MASSCARTTHMRWQISRKGWRQMPPTLPYSVSLGNRFRGEFFPTSSQLCNLAFGLTLRTTGYGAVGAKMPNSANMSLGVPGCRTMLLPGFVSHCMLASSCLVQSTKYSACCTHLSGLHVYENKAMTRCAFPRASIDRLHPESTPPTPTFTGPGSTTELKQHLVQSFSIEDSKLRAETVRSLLLRLEAVPEPRPETALFAEFALSGTWEILFSSSPSGRSRDIRVDQLTQSFDIEAKVMTNSCTWAYLGPDGVQKPIRAVLDVICSYAFPNDTAQPALSLKSHQLRFLDSSSEEKNMPPLPVDMREVVVELQRSLPVEFFDPSGPFDITYIDPAFRISCMTGERLFGVRTVFQRCK